LTAVVITLIALGIAVSPGAPAADASLPPDLALVPTDAAAFVHVHVGDLARSEHLRDLRRLLSKAGQDALKAFNDRFVPAPASLDRVTVYVLPPADGRHEPDVVGIVTTSAPFRKARLIKSLIQDQAKEEGGNVYGDANGDTALYVPSDRLFAIGPTAAIKKLAAPGRSAGDGSLTPALALAAGGKAFVAAANPGVIPADELKHAPPPIQPFIPLLSGKLVTLVVDFDRGTHLDLRAKYGSERSAEEAERAARNGIEMARQHLAEGRTEMERRVAGSDAPKPAPVGELPEAAVALFRLAVVNQADDILKTLPLRREAAELRLEVTVPPGPATLAVATSAVGVGLLLPATQKVREAAERTKSSNNLKQIVLAMHNYNDAYGGKLPAHAIYSKDGKTPLLSWRIAILPYIEQDNLYRQFHLDEPWDSEHNKKLIPLLPQVYADPTAPPTREPGMTYYQLFVGGGAAWDNSSKHPGIPRTFVDGTSNTIMIAEAGEPVIWTKPDDLTYDPKKPLPKLGPRPGMPFLVALADGSVRSISRAMSEKTLRAAVTAAGGETLGPDW
jgi:hypothetical protein